MKPSRSIEASEIKALIDSGDKRPLADLCKARGLSVGTYYKWARALRKAPRQPRPAVAAAALPKRPATVVVPQLAPMCPPGYMMVMVPIAAFASAMGAQ